MDKASLRETRDLLKQVREEILLRPSGLRPVHLIHCRPSESCGDTAAVRSGEENHVLDGDRPMADRRDILESELQEFLRQMGIDAKPWQREFLVQYLHNCDRPANHVGTQDETSETGEMGDGVRPKGRLIGRDENAVIADELDLCKKIRDEFAIELAQAFEKYGKVPMVRYEEEKKPDGSIAIRYIFAPFDDQQNPR